MMKRLFAAIVACAIFLSGCAEKTAEPTYKMPESMPDNFGFSIRFGYESKNEINTFDRTITKDLVMKGTAKAELKLTEQEMRTIYQKMKDMNIVERTNLQPDKGKVICERTPYTEDSWQIRLDDRTINLAWSDRYCNSTEDARQLRGLRIFVFDIVKSKEEYKRLPEPEGGYD